MRADLWTIVFAATLTASAQSGHAETRVSGYAKSYVIATSDVTQSLNALRVMVDRVDDNRAFQIHAELTPLFSSAVQPIGAPTPAKRAWRITDPPLVASIHDKRAVLQNLDRLNVQFNFDSGDLTIGRQAVTFGMARVINPTDVFLPFDVRTFNTEYRIGVDAVRFQRPLGQLGELDVAIIAGEDARPETSAALVQARTRVGGQDVQLTAMRFAQQNLLGGGLQTAIGGAGFWLEAAAVSGRDDYVRVSTGLDYAFSEDVYALIEYHFNGAGENEPANYAALINSTPYQAGGVFLLGRHYVIPSASVQLSPLWAFGAQAIVNVSDRSAFGSVSATWSVGQNLYADFGLYVFSGDSATEYGDNPQTAYASLRYYF